MADVRLSDIIDVTVYRDLAPVNDPSKTDFWTSGVVASNPLLDELANSAGKTAELPFWLDIDQEDDANISTDDPTVEATPSKVTQGEQIARKQMVNKGWSAMNLAMDLAMGENALQHIRDREGNYFSQEYQKRLLAASLGIMADNVANDSSDMTHDIAAEDIASQTVNTRFSRQAFINSAYTMGDKVDGIVAMAVNSVVMKQMSEQGDVEEVRDANGVLVERSYMGRRLIMDDNMPIIAGGTDGFKYVSVLFGAGAIGHGEGTPLKPFAVATNERAGNGAGQEEFWVRKKTILHPFGFQNTGTPAGNSFTIAELKLAAQWDRVVERKNVPIAFMVTN
jgi:hypothetical protein